MFAAQLTFVVGVDKTENEVEDEWLSPLFILVLYISSPALNSFFTPHKMLQSVCAAISVLLVYLFLVVFMWMLMEGVVLYVALVRVFVKHNKRYIAAFTTFSFGKTRKLV